MKAKITRRWLDSLKPKDGTERGKVYTDRDLPGFLAVVYSSGRITFAVRYRVTGPGRRRSVKLGSYPSTTPEDARRRALAVLGGAARGEDEAARREALRAAYLGGRS